MARLMPLLPHPTRSPTAVADETPTTQGLTTDLELPATVRRPLALERFCASGADAGSRGRTTLAALAGTFRKRLRAQVARDPKVMSAEALRQLIQKTGAQLALAFAHDPELIATPVYEPHLAAGIPASEVLTGVVGTVLLENGGTAGQAALEQVLASSELVRLRDPIAGRPFGVSAAAHRGLTLEAWTAAVARTPDLPFLRGDDGASAMGVAANRLWREGEAFLRTFVGRPDLLALPGAQGRRSAASCAMTNSLEATRWVIAHAPHLLDMPGAGPGETACHDILRLAARCVPGVPWYDIQEVLAAAGHAVRQADGRLVPRGTAPLVQAPTGALGAASQEALMARVHAYTYHEEALPSRTAPPRVGPGR